MSGRTFCPLPLHPSVREKQTYTTLPPLCPKGNWPCSGTRCMNPLFSLTRQQGAKVTRNGGPLNGACLILFGSGESSEAFPSEFGSHQVFAEYSGDSRLQGLLGGHPREFNLFLAINCQLTGKHQQCTCSHAQQG